MPSSLAGGALSEGMRVVVEGLRFPARPVVRLRVGERMWDVPALEGSATRAVWVVPEGLPAGAAALTMRNEDGESRAFPVVIARENGGLYSRNGQGWGPGEAHLVGPARERTPIDEGHPAHAGDEVAIRATGSASGVLVTIAGVPVEAKWAAPAGEAAEVRFVVPEKTPRGCYVPVHLRYRDGLAANMVTIPVADAGARCVAPTVWPTEPITGQRQIGLLVLTHNNLLVELAGSSEIRFTDEEAAFHFFSPPRSETSRSPMEFLPPENTCVTFQGLSTQDFGARQNLLELMQAKLPGKALRAGPEVRLEGPLGKRSIPRNATQGDYFSFVGGERPDYSRPALDLYLAGGSYRATSDGGEDVGAFQVPFRFPPELSAKSLNRMDTVVRQRGMKLQWSGGAKDEPTYVLAVSVRSTTSALGACVCTVAAGQNHFSVPAEALANLPETEPTSTLPLTLVFLISATEPTRFDAKGLEAGFVLPVTVVGRTVLFR